ncbi:MULTISPECIES: LytTR family DNA-binding domain-containing protein [Gordonibacter]|uniref:LytTR family DNA-binding domain-containing protein n=1 Tax=Gordonibacter TaxID=644652 RepID=UPI0012AF6AC2|nr:MULTISPECIES: LytTR family DNA-binding domain-containing protein [Gordonibacter]MCB6561971.1 LytTR family transcriptional regulator DNA-binding domain-containing protein [Gordonibacter urolithinfaciens]MCQ4848349.1 LytTR family transcriptional regulator DNA-binding domain-containing protein [Gordonibacter pamelaeae]MCQ4849006.1 LytTR family transcriptional regulator DNA-binding domain-containing protein [Gordonibacter pamelaeae]MSA61004.1 LytTR family transcriptional regulator [Gordonibacter
MNVTITENPALDDIEVSVACPRIDERVQRIVASLGAFDRVLIGERDGATFRVGVEDVCYAETVDGKTFLYTADAVYQTPLKLYELEERLAGTEFVRASKQMLVNFDHVASIRPALNARLQLMLDNGEAAIVSRQYAPAIKRKLGL